MDSRRWLVGLTGLALALIAGLVVDLARSAPTPPGGRVLPDWDARSVRAIRIEPRGRPSLVLARDGADWRIEQPIAAPADPSAVADLLGTLEIMAARRRDHGRVSDPLLSVTVERTGVPSVTLDLARDTGATDRVWLSRRGEDSRVLVDGYQVRALDLAADDVRERRPFRGRLRGARRIEIAAGSGRVVLEGPPWRVAGVRADPDRVAALLAALERLRASGFLPVAPRGPVAVVIAVVGDAGRAELTLHGDCPDGAAAARTPIGSACLPVDDLDPLSAVAGRGEELQDRRLLAATPDEVIRLRVSAGARSIAIERADRPDVVRSWAAGFAEGALPSTPPLPSAGLPVTGRVEIETDGGREELAIHRSPQGTPCAQRVEEPVCFRLADPALVDPSPRNFRSLDLLSADPTALRSARRGVEHIERGELLEEWRALAPPGATADPSAAAEFSQAVTSLHAIRVARAQVPRAYRPLVIELTPPPGQSQPVRHRIDLAPGPGGICFARLAGDPTAFELAPDTCAALQRRWTTR